MLLEIREEPLAAVSIFMGKDPDPVEAVARG
jgi:hypothetical protein